MCLHGAFEVILLDAYSSSVKLSLGTHSSSVRPRAWNVSFPNVYILTFSQPPTHLFFNEKQGKGLIEEL